MSARSRFVVGIDLGTTNSVVAYADTSALGVAGAKVRPFPVPQLVSEGLAAPRAMLPSAIYLLTPQDPAPARLRLPWGEPPGYIVGELARKLGGERPGQLVLSAKSWLCHGGVNRQAQILPWTAGKGIVRISPVEASARVLRHIRHAWDQMMAKDDPELRLEHQDVTVTVPASFDQVARELTVEAAALAGLKHAVLLEEPQAAFYDWISRSGGSLAAFDGPVQALIIDVGGGTADFSLIRIDPRPEGVVFERAAVGEHLLLGGDNMDLALAHSVEQQAAGPEGRLDARRWSRLVEGCKSAKEQLFSPGGPEQVQVFLPSTGSQLIGGSTEIALDRAAVADQLQEGFFPLTGLDSEESRTARTGLQQWGLPFAGDPAVTRHLAGFLRRQLLARAVDGPAVRPGAVLFNGGALTPAWARERLLRVLQDWFQAPGEADWRPLVLDNPAPDSAVAAGAAYYGLVRRGQGIRIGGGLARSYYILAGSGKENTAAVCLAAKGMQEGEEVRLQSPEFAARTNRPVAFTMLVSEDSRPEQVGAVRAEHKDLRPLPPLRTILRFGKKSVEREVPVLLDARLTEAGVLDIACLSKISEHRWPLRFDLRAREQEAPDEDGAPREEATPWTSRPEFVKTAALVQACFDAPPAEGTARGPDPLTLMRQLEEASGMARKHWPLAFLRALFSVAGPLADRRKRTADHEMRWFNLAGLLLRPGYGDKLDETRVQRMWTQLLDGPAHANDPRVMSEWWVMWRRVAGGLSAGSQESLADRIFALAAADRGRKRSPASPQEEREMWRLLGSLERVTARAKQQFGDEIISRLKPKAAPDHLLWALGRIGARMPLYGPVNDAVSAKLASSWLRILMELPWSGSGYFAFAAANIGRLSGDRQRDIDDHLREQLIVRLREEDADQGLVRMVREMVELDQEQSDRIFGEALPEGLVILGP